MKIIKNIFIVLSILLCVCCSNYVGWETNPEVDLEEYLMKSDRTVYSELSVEDIIRIVDNVMKEISPDWPGDLPNDCVERMGWYDVYFFEDIHWFCPEDIQDCIGVIHTTNWVIHVSKDQDLLGQYETLGHEFVHHVGKCFYKDEDGDHDRFDFWKRNDPENSIEAIINEKIRQETR